MITTKSNAVEYDVVLASHPTELYLSLDSQFPDEDWLSWEPETLLLSLREKISDQAKDKLLAVHAVAANSSMVLRNSVAFEKVVMAFCNNVCVMDAHQPPFVEELVYAVRQMRKIIKLAHPDDGDKAVFGDEVPGYVAAVAKFRGWFYLPAKLGFAQDALNILTGLTEESDLRKKHADVFRAVEKVYSEMRTRDAQALLDNAEIEDIADDDSMSANLTMRLIGALLYDPTILYSKTA